MKFSNQACLFILIIALLILCPADSFAYIDPGAGSYIIQVIIAGIVAGSFAIKIFWRELKAFLQSLFSKKKVHE